MVIATSPSRVPVLRLILAGIGVAFALVLLGLLTGFGSTQASADDGDDREGVLSSVVGVVGDTVGGVTDVVDSTLDAATTVVTTTTKAATTTVDNVVDTAPAPVQSVAKPVVSTVTTVVEKALEPVAAATDSGIVSGVVTPVADLVKAVPVVGGVVSGIGLDGALTDVATSIDGTLDSVVGAVGDAAAGLGEEPPLVDIPGIVTPGQPGDVPAVQPGTGAIDDAFATDAAGASPLATFQALARAFSALTAAPVAAVIGAGSTSGAFFGGVAAVGLLSSVLALGVCAPGGSFPSGSGGAGPGALALAAVSPFAAHRAWVRRRVRDDDEAPVAPVLGTDVSPD